MFYILCTSEVSSSRTIAKCHRSRLVSDEVTNQKQQFFRGKHGSRKGSVRMSCRLGNWFGCGMTLGSVPLRAYRAVHVPRGRYFACLPCGQLACWWLQPMAVQGVGTSLMGSIIGMCASISTVPAHGSPIPRNGSVKLSPGQLAASETRFLVRTCLPL